MVGTLGCSLLDCVCVCAHVCVRAGMVASTVRKSMAFSVKQVIPFVSGILSSSAYRKFACELGAWFLDGDHRRRCTRPKPQPQQVHFFLQVVASSDLSSNAAGLCSYD